MKVSVVHVFVVGACVSKVLFASALLPPLNEANLRDRFRPDANPEWGTDFGSPKLADGRMAIPGNATDIILHSGSVLADIWYPFQWERDWMAHDFLRWSRRWWWLAPVTAVSYLCLVWLGMRVMESRKPFELKWPLAVWNLLLAVFSWIGVSRTVPHLFMLLGTAGFDYSVCRNAFNACGHGPVGLWIVLFIMSKFFELIDTAFLVLRKKPVPFLHWYHHCTVLLYCWHAYLLEAPTGFHFSALNFSVHAVMYLYYFLAAVAKPPKWGRAVTVLQLSQMVIGIAVTLRHLHLMYGGLAHCDGYIPNLTGALMMYASYFLLFAKFFVDRYCLKRRPTDKVNGDVKGLKKE